MNSDLFSCTQRYTHYLDGCTVFQIPKANDRHRPTKADLQRRAESFREKRRPLLKVEKNPAYIIGHAIDLTDAKEHVLHGLSFRGQTRETGPCAVVFVVGLIADVRKIVRGTIARETRE
jgi:hypothetical protein